MSAADAAGRKEPAPLPACDLCTGLPAVVYCRFDSARLCLPCDRHVHGANTVSTRHTRAPLCAGCRAAVASRRGAAGVFVCANCHFEEEEVEQEDRGAVEGYAGCPSTAELAAILGVAGCDEKAAAGDGGWWPAWEEPQVLRLEDVIVPTTSCHGLQPLLTPPSPKNRSSGGKLAEEVIRQLGELAKSEAAAAACAEMELADGEQLSSWASSEYATGHGGFGALLDTEPWHDAASMAMVVPSSEREAWIAPGCNVDAACRPEEQEEVHEHAAPAPAPAEPCLSSFVEMSEICPSMTTTLSHGGGGSKAADAGTAPPAPARKGGYDVAYPDRGTVISRYKEKRKNRRFDKQIRYESRKARADGRVRIKGRFAKSGEV